MAELQNYGFVDCHNDYPTPKIGPVLQPPGPLCGFSSCPH